MTENSSHGLVLVTGATGFVGRNLVEMLLNGGYAVRCLVRSAGKARELAQQGAQLVIGDINDARTVREAARGVHTVFHLAALIKAASREDYIRVNRTGTRVLLEALAEVCPDLNRFVHISSLSAAGPSRGNGPLDEKEKPCPVSWYGESKLLSEEEVGRFAGAFPVSILRPSAVYGPHDTETLLIFRMVQRGCLVTPGRFIRRFSLIHVRDLVSACIRAAECPTPSGEVFFISRPEIFTWEDVGRTIAEKIGRKIDNALPGGSPKQSDMRGIYGRRTGRRHAEQPENSRASSTFRDLQYHPRRRRYWDSALRLIWIAG
jgi:nucleoside-diphosphate-sugar epimerase